MCLGLRVVCPRCHQRASRANRITKLATRTVATTLFMIVAGYLITHTVDECDNSNHWAARATIFCWLSPA